jgi:AcrR family transcriptional regulator
MAEVNLSVAAGRLLTAAMQLFADKGYERTTVGEIQVAAGLTFGSGALYKHFPSKESVLVEGIDRFVESARTDRKTLEELDAETFAAALLAIAQGAMSSFARDKDALRIAWRDLEGFPELQEKVRTERIRATFDDLSAWLEHHAKPGNLDLDLQAVSAVALGSLAFFQILKFLMHDTPGGVNEERFVRAWTLVFDNVLSS